MNSPSREDQQAQVLVAGDVNCSLEGAISVLSSTNERELNATMKGLYRKEFIYGSIVHVVSPMEPMPEETPHARQGKFSGSLVVAKTGTFVRSQLFSRNEEWCFVEANERSPCGDAFRLTQSTIDAAEIGVRRVAAHSRVDQLRDVTTAFLVEKQPNNRSVQLFFHGKFDCRNGSNNNTRRKNSGVVSSKASKARLLALAKGVSRIPNIIRRWRVGIQTLAVTSVFAKRTNSHCTCCTERLHLLKRKKSCYLCGYYVCNKCWSMESMETNDGDITLILLCSRCLECVNSCEYSEISSSKKSQRMVRVEPDTVVTDPSSKKALVHLLETALNDSDEAIQAAAKILITYILNQDSSTQLQQRNKPQESITDSNDGDGGSLKNAKVSDPEDPVRVLETLFELEPQPSLGDCVLVNVDSRNYRIRMPRNQTLCSHLIMDDKPLLLLYPEADVRFCHLDAVAKSGIRFYCGFPITARTGEVVSSLCCLDFQQRTLTRSQYATMKKLAATASRVIQTRSIEMLSGSYEGS